MALTQHVESVYLHHLDRRFWIRPDALSGSADENDLLHHVFRTP